MRYGVIVVVIACCACEEHHDVSIELPRAGRAMTKEERRETQRVADAAFHEARAQLDGLPTQMTLIVRWGTDVIPETGESGTASYPGNVMWTVDSSRDVGRTIREELRPSLIHELHHLARASRVRSTTLLDRVVAEGLASAFERDVAKNDPPWAVAPPEAWTSEILALPPATEVDPWMHTHPDGRRWIGMRVGTAIVDRATRASGKSAAALVFATTDEVLRLAGVAKVTAKVAPTVIADPTDPLELEAKSEWDKTQHVDIVYVPTPQKVVDKMLDVAHVTASDVVYDLGCGDGRIVVTAAKRGAKATGFDLDPARVAEARAKAGNTAIRWANVFSLDLSPATVVTLYLLPQLNTRLIPQLEKLRPGSRIVSHDFDMAGVKPDAEYTVTASEFVNAEGHSAYKGDGVPEDKGHYEERTHHVYLWTIPFHKR